MSFAEDLNEFLDTDQGFAVDALYNAQTAITGIFSNDYFPIGVEHADVESKQPMFACREVDVPDIAEDDTFAIDGTTYKVADPQPDGTGWLRISLIRQ